MIEEKWEFDWNRPNLTDRLADAWLDSRDPAELQRLIHDSEESRVSWDALKLICQELAGRDEEDPPLELLQWYFRATQGHPWTSRRGAGPSQSTPKARLQA